MKRLLVAAGLMMVLALASTAYAGPVTITFTTYGTLAGATFGGSGIPNDDVAITTVGAGSDVITLGLTAHGRYSNPDLGDNNAGLFYAGPGLNNGLDGAVPAHAVGTTWVFDYYMDIAGGGSLDDYSFKLFYDFDPAAGTELSAHGVINFSALAIAGGGGGLTNLQGAESLYFAWLSNPLYVTLPAGPFNPYAGGEYTFSLRAYDVTGSTLLGESAIQVNVPDGGSTLLLLGAAFTGLGLLRRRMKK